MWNLKKNKHKKHTKNPDKNPNPPKAMGSVVTRDGAPGKELGKGSKAHSSNAKMSTRDVM